MGSDTVSNTPSRANTSMNDSKDRWYKQDRLGGLRRFAFAITAFNVLGHTWFGFEQSWAQPFVGLAAAYGMELLLESIDAWNKRRRPRYVGGLQQVVDFFLPAQISGLAVSMLLYANDRLVVVAFAATVAIASKHIFRAAVGDAPPRHFFNPSNFGITITLLLFPWVGIAQPYQFTENLTGMGDWILPGFIVISGSFLNTRYTRRLPLISAWLIGFVIQATARHLLYDTPITAALMPMTGVAFILYTFYMVTDPPTTPSNTKCQIAFGLAVAATYGLLMRFHIVFGLFFALTIVSSVRGLYLYAMWLRSRQAAASATTAPAYLPAPAAAPHAAPLIQSAATGGSEP